MIELLCDVFMEFIGLVMFVTFFNIRRLDFNVYITLIYDKMYGLCVLLFLFKSESDRFFLLRVFENNLLFLVLFNMRLSVG